MLIDHIYIETDCDCATDGGFARGIHMESSRVMCYNGDVSRTEAEDLLRGLPAGAYLVRPCSDGGNKLSLSVMGEDKINHYLIRIDNGYKLDGRHDIFCCLKSFLRAHSQYYLGLQLKLRIPIFARSMFHKVEVWEYETNCGKWEPFSLEQTYRLATLRKSVHKFEDGCTVNLVNKTREVPCIYGTQTQCVRMRTVYGLCEKCTQRTVHPTVKHTQSNKMNKNKYFTWEYLDGNEWKCFEYGKASFQHVLASFSLLCEQTQTIKDKCVTMRDRNGARWFLDLVNNKIVNCDRMRSYLIRKREIHGISCNDVHQERERYLSRNESRISRELYKQYCTSNSQPPTTWTSQSHHVLLPSSEEHHSVVRLIPEDHRKYISTVVRLQDTESWRLLSKEHQLQSLASKNVKLDMLWTESRLLKADDSFDKRVLQESIIQTDCYYFSKEPKPTQNKSALILCKVLYDPKSSFCIVDNEFEATTVHLDQQERDSVNPLFAVFFSENLINNSNTETKKDFADKEISLQP